jgi:hypothetical protein
MIMMFNFNASQMNGQSAFFSLSEYLWLQGLVNFEALWIDNLWMSSKYTAEK